MILGALAVPACAAGAGVEAIEGRPVGAADGDDDRRLDPAPGLSLPVVPGTSPDPTEPPAAEASPGSSTADDAGSTVSTSPVPTPAIELRFAWVVPCAVPVTERRELDDSVARLRYTVRLEADAAGDGLVMRQTDLRVVDIDGVAPSGDESEAVNLQLRVPDVLVGFDGVGTGVRGGPELFDQMITAGLFDDTTFTEDDRQRVIERLESNASLKYWDTWVGGWASLGVVPPAVSEVAGVRLEAVPTSAADRVGIRYTEDLTGAALAESLGVTAADGGDPAAYDSVRRVNRIETVTDPATLRPDWATFSLDVTGEFDNEPATLHELHTVQFDWTAATGCGVG